MTSMFQRATALGVLCCFLVSPACGGVQVPQPPQLGPRTYEADVAGVVIDQDAYATSADTAQLVDVRLSMPITDAGTGPNGERIAPLRPNQPAPFAGVLFNAPALAFVEVEYRGLATQCSIDQQAVAARLAARAVADIQHLQAALLSQRLAYQLMLRSRDADIDQLNSYIQRYTGSNAGSSLLHDVLLFGGGVLVGAAILGVTAIILQTLRP